MVAKPKPSKGNTLIADTPVRQRTASFVQASNSQSQLNGYSQSARMPSPDLPVLIEDTPVKPRAQSQVSTQLVEMSPLSVLSSAPSTPSTKRQPQPKEQDDDDAWPDENADDSFTGSFGSPDVLLLSEDRLLHFSPTGKLGDDSPSKASSAKAAATNRVRRQSQASGFIDMFETPTKKRKISKK